MNKIVVGTDLRSRFWERSMAQRRGSRPDVRSMMTSIMVGVDI
jgi:hypothetical protein